MEQIPESMLTMSWPAAFAILGSVVTMVVGLFGYLVSARKDSTPPPQSTATKLPPPGVYEKEGRRLHDRISSTKDTVAKLETDVRVLEQKVEALSDRIDTHDERDIKDFQQITAKIERLSDIVFALRSDKT